MTTQEKNELICDFMEDARGLQYDRNWNHLMPVVEKIEPLMGGVNILGNTCSIYDDPFKRTGEGWRISITGKDKYEAVYEACFQFITWYNKTKQNASK